MASKSKTKVAVNTKDGKSRVVQTGSKAETRYKNEGASFDSSSSAVSSGMAAIKERSTAATRYARENGEDALLGPMGTDKAGFVKPVYNSVSGTYSAPPTITALNTTPNPGINIPTPPATTTTGSTAMNGVGATATAATANQAALDAAQKETEKSQGDWMKAMLEEPNTEKIYEKTVRDADLRAKTQLVNTFTGQLNAIVAKSQADKLSLVGTGRGVTEAIIGGQQAQIDREAAIQSLPIAAQLSAAQGDLAAAQDQVNTLFKIRAEDASNKYNRKVKVAEAVYGFASVKQKAALDEKLRMDERAYSEKKEQRAFAADLALTALKNGQPTVMASIMNADPNSDTYMETVMSHGKGISISQGRSGGGGSSSSYSVALAPEDRRILTGAGFTSAEIATLEQDVNRIGLDAILKNSQLTAANRAGIKKVFGGADEPLDRMTVSKATGLTDDYKKKDGWFGVFGKSQGSELDEYMDTVRFYESEGLSRTAILEKLKSAAK